MGPNFTHVYLGGDSPAAEDPAPGALHPYKPISNDTNRRTSEVACVESRKKQPPKWKETGRGSPGSDNKKKYPLPDATKTSLTPFYIILFNVPKQILQTTPANPLRHSLLFRSLVLCDTTPLHRTDQPSLQPTSQPLC